MFSIHGQRSMSILTLPVPITDEEKNLSLNFYFNATFRNARDVKS